MDLTLYFVGYFFVIEPNNWVFLPNPGKSKTDDLFDELDTSKLNAHLKELVPGLTAKVFRTYNASITLDKMVCSKFWIFWVFGLHWKYVCYTI